MNKTGPIIVIEDDPDDQYLLGETFRNLKYKNEIIYFGDGYAALKYLTTATIQPFLILSDINMPVLTGMQLKEKIQINGELRLKCIPYIFFTTSTSQKSVLEAYSNSAQGFFVKPSNMRKLAQTIKKIVEYWRESLSPDSYP